MNSPPEEQQNSQTLEHLLAVVAENRDRRCAEILQHVDADAGDILHRAHTKVRARMHNHIAALREKYRLRISAAQARIQTQIRKQQQNADNAFLDEAWPALRDAMLALWKDPASRRDWLESAVEVAAARLLLQQWRIEHPHDLSDEERMLLKQLVMDKQGKAPEIEADDAIEAGIRISYQGTVLDATLDGLLQRRAVIEATLLAQYKQDDRP
ncbi:MAG: hypothetical protein ABFR19_01460 [Pseudomonadota bacterium]